MKEFSAVLSYACRDDGVGRGVKKMWWRCFLTEVWLYLPPLRWSLMYKLLTGLNNYTSIEACLWRDSLLWRAINGASTKVLWRQCFIEIFACKSTCNDKELGNWSKGMPMATMWHCFRAITCKACMYIMIELARHARMCMNLSMHVSL